MTFPDMKVIEGRDVQTPAINTLPENILADLNQQNKAVGLPENYHSFTADDLLPSGLYYFHDGEAMHLCPYLKIIGAASSTKNDGWQLVLEFVTRRGNTLKQFRLPMASLHERLAPEKKLIQILVQEGFNWQGDHNAAMLLLKYCRAADPKTQFYDLNKTGIHTLEDETVFALPSETFSKNPNIKAHLTAEPFTQSGTLKEWQQNIADPAECQSRFALAISLAFSPLCRYLLGETQGWIAHFFGASKDGKTTLAKVAASVISHPDDYASTWNGTDNGLVAFAQQRNDLLSIFDEIGTTDPKNLGGTIYNITNGMERLRCNKNGDLRDVKRWRCIGISNGEKTIQDVIQDGGGRIKAGHLTRCPQIPSDAGKGLGALDNLAGFADKTAILKHFNQAANQYYGTALPAFLEAWFTLPEEQQQAEIAKMSQDISDFNSTIQQDNMAQDASHIINLFAQAAASGELATRLDITGWKQGNAIAATLQCAQDCLNFMGTQGFEIAEGIKHLRAELVKNQFNNFLKADSDGHVLEGQKTNQHWGYRRPLANYGELLLLESSCLDPLLKGYPKKEILKRLRVSSDLVADAGRFQKKIGINKINSNYYALKLAFLEH